VERPTTRARSLLLLLCLSGFGQPLLRALRRHIREAVVPPRGSRARCVAQKVGTAPDEGGDEEKGAAELSDRTARAHGPRPPAVGSTRAAAVHIPFRLCGAVVPPELGALGQLGGQREGDDGR
jgi:hypothetical protein